MSTEQATQLKNEGNKAFSEGRFQEAVDAFTKAIEINPSDHVFYSNRSGAFASLEKFELALEDAIKCISIKPDWAKGYQRKGHAEYELGKLSEAISTYKIGLEKEPGNAILAERLAKVQEEQKKGENNSDDDGMENVAAQMMVKLAQNPRTAAWLKDPSFMTKLQMLRKSPQMFSMLMQQDPRLNEAFNLLISDFSGMGGGNSNPSSDFPTTAGQDFNFQAKSRSEQSKKKPEFTMQEEVPEPVQRGDNSAPKMPEQQKNTTSSTTPPAAKKQETPAVPEHERIKNEGNYFYKEKNFQKALECYDKAIELEPSEVLYYNNKAAVYIELKDLENALLATDSALDAAEKYSVKDFTRIAKIYARKASVLQKQGEYGESIVWYQKSLLEDMNAKVKLELKNVQKLKKDQDELAYIDPAVAEQHNEKAKVFFTEGKFPLALKEYSESIRRSPKDPKYFTNRGICYIKLMEFPSALKDLDQAIAFDPTYVKAYTKKGNCHFAMKEYHKALSTYEKGLEHAPENQELKDLLAKTKVAAYSGGESKQEQEERAQHAMADPEIQNILRTPEVQNALKSLQSGKEEVNKILSNPTLAPKIAKLIEAGILRIG